MSEQQRTVYTKDVVVQCPSCRYEFVNPQWGLNGECNSCHKEYISFGKCSCIRCEE
jgi:hypothetical protein